MDEDPESYEGHFHISMFLKDDSTILEDGEPAVPTVSGRVSFFPDRVSIDIPHAYNEDWMMSAINNVLEFVESKYPISLVVDSDKNIFYSYGMPDPCVNLDVALRSVDVKTKEVEDIQEEWFDTENRTISMQFSHGTAYITENSSVRLEPRDGNDNKDLRREVSSHIFDGMCEVAENRNINISNPYSDLMRSEILYPVFCKVDGERGIEFWNIISEDLFTQNLVTEPTPEISNACDQINMSGLEASYWYLSLMASLEYHAPVSDETTLYFNNNVAIENDLVLNWFKGMESYEARGEAIITSVNREMYDYDGESMPSGDMFAVHSSHSPVIYACEVIGYDPVYPLGDDFNASDKPDYFWITNAWWMNIKGAKPCGHNEADLDEEELRRIMKNEGPTYPVIKGNVDHATEISEDDLDDMVVLWEE